MPASSNKIPNIINCGTNDLGGTAISYNVQGRTKRQATSNAKKEAKAEAEKKIKEAKKRKCKCERCKDQTFSSSIKKPGLLGGKPFLSSTGKYYAAAKCTWTAHLECKGLEELIKEIQEMVAALNERLDQLK